MIDQGSNDDTSDLAHELALEYPQISTFSLPARCESDERAATGAGPHRGRQVLLLDPDCQADLNELPKLWALGRDVRPGGGRGRRRNAERRPCVPSARRTPGRQPVTIDAAARYLGLAFGRDRRNARRLSGTKALPRPRAADLRAACRHSGPPPGPPRRLAGGWSRPLGKPSRIDPANVGPRAAAPSSVPVICLTCLVLRRSCWANSGFQGVRQEASGPLSIFFAYL